jgi:hypothetical protein
MTSNFYIRALPDPRKIGVTDPAKLALLMVLVALAIAWAARVAKDPLGPKWPSRKPHEYLEKSWFHIGFDRIRNRLRSDPPPSHRPMDPRHPKPNQNPESRVVCAHTTLFFVYQIKSTI